METVFQYMYGPARALRKQARLSLCDVRLSVCPKHNNATNFFSFFHPKNIFSVPLVHHARHQKSILA